MSRDTDRVRTYLRCYMQQPIDHRADGTHWARCPLEVTRKKLGIKMPVLLLEVENLRANGELEDDIEGFVRLKLI